MKYLALLLACVKIGTANSNIEHVASLQSKFVTAGGACIEEYPISPDDVSSFKNGVFPDSEHAECFSACVLKHIGIFDEKGNLHQPEALDKAKEVLDETEFETVKELMNVCAKVNEENVTDGDKGCERAKLLFHCFVENSK